MVRQMVVTIVATHTKLEELSGIGFAYWFISRGTVGSTYIQSVPRFNLHSSADTVQLLQLTPLASHPWTSLHTPQAHC